MSPDLSFANADDAISIAAATTPVPIILTMVTDQTGDALRLFNRYHLKSSTAWMSGGTSIAPDTALRRVFDRTLIKITLQLRVEFWMTGTQRGWSLKKSFD